MPKCNLTFEPFEMCVVGGVVQDVGGFQNVLLKEIGELLFGVFSFV